MVIAVIGMRVVPRAVDQVVGVIAVRDRSMAAAGSVHVLVVYRSARIAVGVIDFEAALVNVSVMIVPFMCCVFHGELLFDSSI